MQQHPVVQSPIVISQTTIHQDAEGRYCLNDLHRAAGGADKHGPGRWLRTDACKSLIELIKPKMAYSPIDAKQQVGTFAVKQLVYAYAMWISPEFHLQVIETFDAVVTGQLTANPASMSRMQLLQMAMQAEEERIALEHKVLELVPKADIADRIHTADGLFGFRQAAKILHVNENKFRDWLVRNDWVYYLGKRLTGKARVIQKGYIVERVKLITVVGEDDKSIKEMYFTSAGVHRLAELLNTQLDLGVAA